MLSSHSLNWDCFCKKINKPPLLKYCQDIKPHNFIITSKIYSWL